MTILQGVYFKTRGSCVAGSLVGALWSQARRGKRQERPITWTSSLLHGNPKLGITENALVLHAETGTMNWERLLWFCISHNLRI